MIEGGTELNVVLADRREFPAKVILADARADLAVLKIDVEGERLPVLPIADKDSVQVGDLVLAIGDPFGVGQTVTNGIVSALARTDVGSGAQRLLLFHPDRRGHQPRQLRRAAGGHGRQSDRLNTLIYSRTGSSAGIGFAIPAAWCGGWWRRRSAAVTR